MSYLVDVFYIFISGAVIQFCVSGLLFTAIMPGIDRWSRRFFLSYFSVLMLSCLVCFLELVFYYSHVPVSAMYATLLLESLLMSFPLPMFTVYLLHCSGENMRSSRLLHSVLFMFGVHFVQLAVTPFIDTFFYVMPDGQ